MHETQPFPRQPWDSTDLADPRQLPDDGLGQSPELETIWLEAARRGAEPAPSGTARSAAPVAEPTG
ncbi:MULTISPECIES: hypothetical protein [unclassified Actinopolyspora]|uniref:hypothetical protein n=1 Tax=Actinopolyspora TaxID=1849 RepID=UPI0013F5D566|nr:MULTISPECIES: hypothetical protein [unclassified Actinopolyspora]NHD15764.1 hypothetical protein [Actinopolyspora sp. BKK2]NHE75022.1 hypothetical protein [Actinopolyspora sp. BKK1]